MISAFVLIRRRRTGETSASSRRGHRPRKLTPAQEAALAAHITAEPDLTLAACNVAVRRQKAAPRARCGAGRRRRDGLGSAA